MLVVVNQQEVGKNVDVQSMKETNKSISFDLCRHLPIYLRPLGVRLSVRMLRIFIKENIVHLFHLVGVTVLRMNAI